MDLFSVDTMDKGFIELLQRRLFTLIVISTSLDIETVLLMFLLLLASVVHWYQ